MSDIRLRRITINSHDYPLVIQNGVVNIVNTASSASSISGALVVDGGVSIGCTKSASSTTAGGGLTVNGGIAVLKNALVGQDLNISSATGIFQIDGLSAPRFVVDSVANKRVVMRPDGVNTRLDLSDTTLNINITASSTNSSTGAFVIAGGVSIQTSEDSSSVTNGGSLTVNGGGAFQKNLYIGESAHAKHLALAYREDDSNSSTLEFFKSRNTSNTNADDSLGEIAWYGYANGAYSLAGSISMEQSTVGNSYVSAKFAVNVANSQGDNKQHLVVDAERDTIDINSKTISLTSTHASSLSLSGGANVAKQLVLQGGIASDHTSHTIGSIITTGGNVGISNSAPAYNLDVNGTVNASTFTGGNISLSGTARIPNIFSDSVSTANISVSDNLISTNTQVTLSSIGSLISDYATIADLDCTNISSSNLNITSMITQDISAVNVSVSNLQSTTHTTSTLIANDIITSTLVANDSIRALSNSNTIGNMYTTNGNVGINNVSPDYCLDVNGTLHSSDVVTFSNTTASKSSSSGSLLLSGGLSISNTSTATSLTSGGSITTNGGMSIHKDVFIGGVTFFKDTTPSTSYSEAAVCIAGGLSISQNQNVANVGNGGALTVAGGASIGLDLYVGGEINGSGSSSSSFAYLTLTSTDEAVNLTSGSLITFGGVTIQCTTNATSISDGGSLLVNGGASFNGDTHFLGSQFLNNPSNYYSPTDDVINIYDDFQIKRLSLDLDKNSYNFSISRYDALANFVEKAFEISNANGTMYFYNTTPSTSNENAALVIDGGVSVRCTVSAYNTNNGGSLSVYGGTSIKENLLIGGDTHIYSTTPSSNVSTGAFLVDGGAGISGNLHVLGNTVLNGDLTIRGTTTTVISNNTVIGDNVLVLNSGPSGSKDSGIIIERYQIDNNTGSGDVVNATTFTSVTLPIQGSIQSTEVKFDSSLSAVDNYYNGWWIKIASGFSNNQVRKIVAYNGAQRLATCSSAWQSQNPSQGDSVYLYNKPFVGLKYNEINDRFEFGSAASDDFNSITDTIPIAFHSATSTSTEVCDNPTSGSIQCSGGLLLLNTTDATSTTSGGSFMSMGGGSFSKTLHVGNALIINGINMTPNSGDIFTTLNFQASNGQTPFADITGIAFADTVWGFDVYLAAQLNASSNLYANFHIRGVNRGDSWETVQTYVGDDMGLDFRVNDSGQLQYTSYSHSGFTSLNFRCRALAN